MSVFVLLLISSMIVAAIVIINPDIVNLNSQTRTVREAITLDEAMMGELSGNHFSGRWISSSDMEGDQLLYDESKNIRMLTLPRFNAKEVSSSELKVSTVLANTSMLASIGYQGYKLSPSKRFLLVWEKRKKEFRHSFTARYLLYDMKREFIAMLSTFELNRDETATGKEGDEGTSYLHNSYEPIDAAAQYLQDTNPDTAASRFQLVDWFPSAQSDSLILIQNNDIYMMNNIQSVEQSQQGQSQLVLPKPIRLTRTGRPRVIFNGVSDWLYEEEILGDTPAYELSPSSQSLAYMSFNDSQVDRMPITMYGAGDQLIPRTKHIRYPKAGRVNPRVRVHIIDNISKLTDQDEPTQLQLELPDDLSARQHYISRMKWLTEDKLVLTWLNRLQNESYFVICTRQTGWMCEKNLHLTAVGGWLELGDQIEPLDDSSYLTLLPKDEGANVGSFRHVAKVSINQFNRYQFLTAGRREVISIDGVHRDRELVFYTSSVLGEPGQRQIYFAPLNPSNEPSLDGKDSCITCHIYPDQCLFNFAKFSPSTNYYIFECAGPAVPRTELRLVPQEQTAKERPQLEPAGVDSTLLWTLADNLALENKLVHEKAMPLSFRLKVPIEGTNYSASVILYLPPKLSAGTVLVNSPNPPASSSAALGLARSSSASGPNLGETTVRLANDGDTLTTSGAQANARAGKSNSNGRAFYNHLTAETINEYIDSLDFGQQYPMVVDVYAGPGSQKADFHYNVGFGHYLASSKRIVYAMIDGRGSGFEGSKRLYELYHKFGTVEIEDQVQVARYLSNNLSFIDSNRVAIWGWSYGGYAAAKALARSSKEARQQAISQRASDKSLLSLLVNNQVAPIVGQQNNSSLSIESSQSSASTDVLSDLTTPRPISNLASLHPIKGGVFKCAVSVAPVTNWILYDTAYTERYMSSPYENEQFDDTWSGDHENGFNHNSDTAVRGYPERMSASNVTAASNRWMTINQTLSMHERFNLQQNNLADYLKLKKKLSSLNSRYREASLLDSIGDIDRKRFLLVHGTADDNVHFQQSIMLMRRLIQQNILFDTRLYPDQDHGIGNTADKLHLGNTLDKFFSECLGLTY